MRENVDLNVYRCLSVCRQGEERRSGSAKVKGGAVTEDNKCCFFKLLAVFALVHVRPALSSSPRVTVIHQLVIASCASAPAVSALCCPEQS